MSSREKALWCSVLTDWARIFSVENGKNTAYGGRKGQQGVYFSPELVFLPKVNMFKVFFPFCTLTWRVNNYVSHEGTGINGRNESTKNIDKFLLIFSTLTFNWLYGLWLAIHLRSNFPVSLPSWIKDTNNSVFTTFEHISRQNDGNVKK